MFTRRKLAVFGISVAAALALVGVGGGATFTDSGSSEMEIRSGTLAVEVTPLLADGKTVDPDAEVVVTHPQAGPHAAYVKWTLKNVDSTFAMDRHVKFTNIGTLPVKLGPTTFKPAGVDEDPLASQVLASAGGMNDTWFEPVRWLESVGWTDGPNLGVGESWVSNFHFTSQAGGLTNDAMGQTITPMFGFLKITEGTAAFESSADTAIPVK
jgi:hypothetical protein